MMSRWMSRRTLLDLLELGVAQPLLHEELPGVAPAPVGLQGGVGHPGGVLRGDQLGDGGLGGDVPPASNSRAARIVTRWETSVLAAMSARRKATAWWSMIGRAELVALLRVSDRGVQRGPRQPRGPGADEDPGGIEGAHQAVEALPSSAEAVGHRHPDVVQEDLGVDDASLPHLAHRLARSSRPRHPARTRKAVTPLGALAGSTVAKTTIHRRTGRWRSRSSGR